MNVTSSSALTVTTAAAVGARLIKAVIGVSTPSRSTLTLSILLIVTPSALSCSVAPAVCVLSAAVEPAAANWESMKDFNVARSDRMAAVKPAEVTSKTTVSTPEPPLNTLTPVPPFNVSLPVPPFKISLPAPPTSKSLPPSPFMVSSPFSP